jgi:predicted nicotinamide N-methyase
MGAALGYVPAVRTDEELRRFVEENTALVRPPLLPEIALHLATEVTPLWQATEQWLRTQGIEPPFWAFAWAGGQALARLLLDRPALVQDKVVLDFASGSGLCAIAAARAGARRAVALDRDRLAAAAIGLNAMTNGVTVEPRCADVLGVDQAPAWVDECEVVLAGDVFYDASMAAVVLPWLRGRAAAGALVLLGDPGRTYLPAGLSEVARYRVPTIDDVESAREKAGVVYRVD